MWTNILLGSLMVLVTVAIHGSFMILALRLHRVRLRGGRNMQGWHRLVPVAAAVLVMFGASLLEVTVWAATFVALGAISGVEPALYFSAVTFTTLGYGDLVLDERWRLLGAFEAANGIIMFGWTTAVVVAVVQRVFRSTSD